MNRVAGWTWWVGITLAWLAAGAWVPAVDAQEAGAQAAEAAALRQAMAPFQPLLEGLPEDARLSLETHARVWIALPAEQQEQLRENLEQWDRLDPPEKLDLRRRYEAWQAMSPEARERVLAAAQQHAAAAVAQRESWREAFTAMPRSQRERYLMDPPTRALLDTMTELFGFVPVGEHAATRALLSGLDPGEVQALRTRLARRSQAHRDAYRRELLERAAAGDELGLKP